MNIHITEMNILPVILSFAIYISLSDQRFLNTPITQTTNEIRKTCRKQGKCFFNCLLEQGSYLTESGDGLNLTAFDEYHKPFAEECFNYTTKLTCKEGRKFVRCFQNMRDLKSIDNFKQCREEFPVKNVKASFNGGHLKEGTTEENLTCFTSCLMTKKQLFLEDDTLNMNAINFNSPWGEGFKEAAVQCQENNMQDDQCDKRANIYWCLMKAQKDERKTYFTRRKELKNRKENKQ